MHESREIVDNLAGFFNNKIWLVKTLVAGVFAYFVFIKFGELLNSIELPVALLKIKAQILEQLALIAYSSSWLMGCLTDVEYQRTTYHEIAVRPKIERTANWLAFFIFVSFTFVCYATTISHIVFWSALLGFCLVDYFAWHWLMRNVLKATYEKSKEMLLEVQGTGYVKHLIKLEITRNYVAGKWKNQRYLVMGLVILIGLLFSIFPQGYEFLSNKYHIPQPVLAAGMLWIYVIIAESWMWFYRFQCKLCHSQINDIFAAGKILWKLRIGDSKSKSVN